MQEHWICYCLEIKRGIFFSHHIPWHASFLHIMGCYGYKVGIQFNKSVLVVEQNNYATKGPFIVNCFLNCPKNCLKSCMLAATDIVKDSDKGNYVYCRHQIGFVGGSFG